jgi:pimeloyl-ACP methyl ester carboxylesterase
MPELRASDGTRLFYKDVGEGLPLLFVHAWSLDSAMWEYQVVTLLDAGYRCIAMDRRGHGRSDVASAGYDLDALAGDLGVLVDLLGLTSFAVVAHSLGAAETVRLLSRRPDLPVDRLVLSGTITPGPGAAGVAVAERTITELRADRAGWFRAGAGAYFALPGSDVSTDQVDDTMVHILQPPLEVQEACVRTMCTFDASEELRQLDRPVLLVHGDADVSAPLALTAQPTAALLPRAELRVYPGAGHGLYVSHREQLNADLVAFLG